MLTHSFHPFVMIPMMVDCWLIVGITILNSTERNAERQSPSPPFHYSRGFVRHVVIPVIIVNDSPNREDIKKLIVRAITDDEKGMGIYGATITDDALDFLSDMAEGDARSALNAIELGILTTEPAEDGKIHIDIDVAQECIQRRVTKYDKDGDNHYDVISAFIKSMRGSDPDAAIYYLARMIDAGESVTFIARRIMICASEDVGNADPQALQVAVAA